MKLRKLAPLIILFCALVTAFCSFYGDDSYARLRSLKRTLTAQRQVNMELRERVGELRDQVYGIQHDPRVLEKAARNELGLARPHELIFVFDDASKPGEAAKAPVPKQQEAE